MAKSSILIQNKYKRTKYREQKYDKKKYGHKQLQRHAIRIKFHFTPVRIRLDCTGHPNF